jgi:hypothetical protein
MKIIYIIELLIPATCIDNRIRDCVLIKAGVCMTSTIYVDKKTFAIIGLPEGRDVFEYGNTKNTFGFQKDQN